MERKTFSRIGFGLGLAEISVLVFGFLLSLLLTPFAPFTNNASILIYLLQYLVMYAGMIGMLWLLTFKLPHAPETPKTTLTFSMLVAVFLICLGFGNLLALVGSFADNFMDSIVYSILDNVFGPLGESVVNEVTKYDIIASTLASCIMAPVFEEIMFRKILLDKLRPFGDKVAILISGITFGLFHLNFTQFALATAIGFLLGYIMLRTNNLAYVILLHFVYNFTQSLPGILSLSPVISATVLEYYQLSIMGASIVLGLALFFTNLKRIELHRAPFRFSSRVNGAVILGNVGAILYLILCALLFLYHSAERVLP